MSTTAMINTHPNPTTDLDVDLLAEAIDAALACAQTCTACADACLADRAPQHARDCRFTEPTARRSDGRESPQLRPRSHG